MDSSHTQLRHVARSSTTSYLQRHALGIHVVERPVHRSQRFAAVIVVDGEELRVPAAEDYPGAIGRLHSRECAAAEVHERADIRFGDRWTRDGTCITGSPLRAAVVMLGDLQLGYLGVEVPDVAALGGFLADVVGLVPGDDPGTWRNDSKARRVVVTEGSTRVIRPRRASRSRARSAARRAAPAPRATPRRAPRP